MDNSDWLDVAGKIALGVGGAALATAGVLAAKSGAFQSVGARRRRNADERLIEAPRAGTPLLVSLAGMAEHSGVFLGRSRVAELNGDGRLMDVSLSEFINGQPDDKIGDWLKDGSFSIERLETVVSAVMNGGNPIAWLGVREPSRFFNYVLSEDKINRLRREGKMA